MAPKQYTYQKTRNICKMSGKEKIYNINRVLMTWVLRFNKYQIKKLMKHESRILVILLPTEVIFFEYSMSSTWSITKEDTEQIPNSQYHTFLMLGSDSFLLNQDSHGKLLNYFSEAKLLEHWQFSHKLFSLSTLCAANLLSWQFACFNCDGQTLWESHIKFF